MAAVARAKTLGSTFSKSEEFERVVYDFAKDGGATSTLTLYTAAADLIVTHFHMYVKTACTSGGSATVSVGVNGAATAFVTVAQGAVASLTLGAFFQANVVLTEGTPNTAVFPLPRKLASGGTITMTIGTAALTAGVLEFCIRYIRA